MTPRRRAILIVTLAILLIGVLTALVLLLLSRRAPQAAAPAPEPAPTAADNATQPIVKPPAVNPLSPPVAPAPSSTAAVQMAELFAERYGSYSNQGDFQNLSDLLPVLTIRYRAETEAYLASASAVPGAAYEGVTSVKVSSKVRSFSEKAGTAVIAVTLQQSKSSGGSAATVSYRTLKLELQNAGKGWKVDTATWEN